MQKEEIDLVNSDCWIWVGAKTPAGYGQLTVCSTVRYAHRLSYEFFVGPIPKGKQLDHLCRNRACFNPEHLEAVSVRENVLRGIGITAVRARAAHCIRGHLLAAPNLIASKKGFRVCKACRYMRLGRIKNDFM